MLKSELSKTMINNYRAAHYRVEDPPSSFIFRIKKQSAELEALMKRHDQSSAAYLTAYNPYNPIYVAKSQKTKENLNVRAQKALRRDIQEMGFIFYNGVGEDPTGIWKGEPSFLVLGISLESAIKLGEKYGQNAVVWVDEDAVPHLELLR